MRHLLILAAMGLAACQPRAPQDCASAARQAPACIERHRAGGTDGRDFLLDCFPFSDPERIAGAWVTGFETDEFYEGQVATASLIHRDVGGTQLVMEEEEEGARDGALLRLYQMELTGRRSRCEMGFPRHYVIVDEVISRTEVTPR
jgi:hypothetical protein